MLQNEKNPKTYLLLYVALGLIVFLFIMFTVLYPVLAIMASVFDSALLPFMHASSGFTFMGFLAQIASSIDLFLVILLFGSLMYATWLSWENPSKSAALIYLLGIFILGYLFVWVNNIINPVLPFYAGELPIMFSMIASGYIALAFFIVLAVNVVFNVRVKPVAPTLEYTEISEESS